MKAARLTVLVVEGPTDAESPLVTLLQGQGYQVRPMADAAAAVQVATGEGANAVCLDLQLPSMDALQVLEMLRSTQVRTHLPVLVLSARDDRERRIAALKLGADDVVFKPFDPEDLLARLRRSLEVGARFNAIAREVAALHELAQTDALTEIHNRRFFEQRLKEEFRRAQRYDDALALMLLDVDEFKSVNDTFGHPEGDHVLKEVAAAIGRSVRDTDLTARYGGEEFAVILPKTALAGALTVGDRVWREIAKVRAGPAKQRRVTASLGISAFPSRSVVSSEHLLRAADEALYRAKHEGRNKICLFQAPAAGTQLRAN